MRRIAFFLFGLSVGFCSGTASTNTKFTVELAGIASSPDAVYIAKDAQPFFAKGVAYSPVPLGASFHFAPQIGDWFHGPWQQIAKTDLPLMKDLGINSFRTYAFWYWQPTNDLTQMRSLTQASPITATGSSEPFDDRDGFFQALADNDIYAILGIALDGGNVFNGGTDRIKLSYANFYLQTAEKLASLYGDEPNVMAFCMANEQNQGPRNTSAYVWSYYYLMAERIRAGLGDNEKLITIAWQNDTTLYDGSTTVDLSDSALSNLPSDGQSPSIDFEQAGKDLRSSLIGWNPSNTDYSAVPVEMIISTICDVWGLNIYAGMEESLQTYQTNVFDKAFRKPLLITEWGHSATTNDPAGAKGPSEGTARLKEKSKAGRQTAASNLNADVEAMNSYLAFVNGGTYFEWTDEWWKNDSYWDLIPQSQQDHLNQQIANWQPGDPVPSYNTQPDGRMNFEAANGTVVGNGYPQYTFTWDGTDSAEWPEEGWGLHSVAPNTRQAWDNPWNVAENKPWPVDDRTERPLLVDALMGRSSGAYPGKGYPWLEANHMKLINDEELEGWHYVVRNNWAYDSEEAQFVRLLPSQGDSVQVYHLESQDWGSLHDFVREEWAYIFTSGWMWGVRSGWSFLQSPFGNPFHVLDIDGAWQTVPLH